jgi:hypothetical protein
MPKTRFLILIGATLLSSQPTWAQRDTHASATTNAISIPNP